MTQNTRPRVIDLFAGVGGFSLGATRAGFDLLLAVENDKHALAAHKRNFPNSKHLDVDIGTLSGAQLAQAAALEADDLDGLIGGPPCQGFSVIGKRNSVDPRNNLFVKFFDLVRDCRPKFFVAENVLGILHGLYDEVRDSALQSVEKDYWLTEPMRLKASDFGAPTSRERVFFVGLRRDVGEPLSSDDFCRRKVDAPVTVGEALIGLPIYVSEEWLTEDASWCPVGELPNTEFWTSITNDIPEGVGDRATIQRYQAGRVVSGCFGTRHAAEVVARYGALKPGERDRVSKSVRLKADGFCPTLRAGTGSDRGSYQAVRPIHPTLPRVITPREAARLQGFPDWFRFAPSKWHSFRQIGNSVSPMLAEILFDVIRAHLKVEA